MHCQHLCYSKNKAMAMTSSSVPLKMSGDSNMACHESPVSIKDGSKLSDAPLLSNSQLTDGEHSKEDVPLQTGSSTAKLVEEATAIDDLPDDVMLEIFSYMSLSENINILQEVCARWKILAQNAHLWHDKEYVIRYETSEEEAIAAFAAIPQLRTVILEKEVSPEVFEVLSRSCRRLTSLKTTAYQMLTYLEAETLFNGCKEIRTLTISDRGLRADTRFLDAVAQLADLQMLYLRASEYQQVELPLCVLADGCPQLSYLELGRYSSICYRIQNAEYFLSSHKHVLKCLRIRWTSIEGRCITPLLHVCAETLEHLELTNYDAVSHEEAAEALTALGQLHSLLELRFGVTDWGVRHLVPDVFENGSLPKLQQLCLSFTVVDETTCSVAKHCPELREFELSYCGGGHTDKLFEPLRHLKKLEILTINGCKCLGGKAMSYIAKLPTLHTLNFISIKFDALKPSVDCILQMSGLRRIYLQYSICWAIPFDKFPGRLVNLRELEIDYCDGNQDILDRITAQMPDLRVKGSLGALFTDEEDYPLEYE